MIGKSELKKIPHCSCKSEFKKIPHCSCHILSSVAVLYRYCTHFIKINQVLPVQLMFLFPVLKLFFLSGTSLCGLKKHALSQRGVH